MLKIITFRSYTISALWTLVGHDRWSASYMVCDRGRRICHSSEVPMQSSPELAESAALIAGCHYVEDHIKQLRKTFIPQVADDF